MRIGRRLRWFLAVIGVLFCILFVRIYVSTPIRARVVDAGTGIPLEGVIVVADWKLMGGLEGTVSMGHIATFETTTAADGSFEIPRWGPRIRLTPGWLDDDRLKLFLPGYRPLTLTQRRHSYSPLRRSDWDGKEVRLERWTDGALSYDQQVAGVHQSLLYELGGWDRRPSCYWRNIPRLLRVIEAERVRLLESGVASTIKSPEQIDRALFYSVARCGSIAAMIRGHE
jgi:hypothetical protein